MIAVWLGGTKIKRISLHMCYGGGNRNRKAGGGVEVRVKDSFAYKLASYCGELADDVTGRTLEVAITVLWVPNRSATGSALRR
jgi:hypothetical protein